jgi:hypothetical protein
MHPPSINTRTRRHNLLSDRAVPKGNARNVNVAIEAWALFFPDNIIQDFTNFTNIYISTILNYYSDEKYAKYTSLVEIKAFWVTLLSWSFEVISFELS